MTYQGWKNYETSVVARWIDGHEEANATARDLVRDAANEPLSLNEAVREIKAWLEEEMPDPAGMWWWSDLLRAAFDEVDWLNLAMHYQGDAP